MDGSSANGPPPPLAEGLVRTLRHEIGDFLQSVYSSVAILQARLPASASLERTIVANLRTRAETCKHLLDTVHDVVFPVTLAHELVRLPQLAAELAAQAAARYAHLDVRAEAEEVPPVQGDAARLQQVGSWLLENACHAAKSRVRLRTVAGPGPGEVSWLVSDDGPALAPEQKERLFDTFTTTRRGTLGLGLGAVRKVVTLHGGRVEADNGPEGGVVVHVTLLAEAPEAAG